MLAQGYEADNPNIELLRLRNFTAGTRLKEDEVLSPNFLHRTLEIIGALKPLVSAKSPSLPLPSDRNLHTPFIPSSLRPGMIQGRFSRDLGEHLLYGDVLVRTPLVKPVRTQSAIGRISIFAAT